MTKHLHGCLSDPQSPPPATEHANSECAGPLTALAEIQRKYALILLSGTHYVFDREALASKTDQGCAHSFQPLKRQEATLLITRYINELFPGANAIKLARDFFVSPETTCYSGLEFNPKGNSDNLLNIWIPPTIKPAKGNWSKIRDFIKHIICNGNQKEFSYLMNYLSHALQRPWEKPGVMVILLGGQGVGKGTLSRILRAIWKGTYRQIHQINSITGEFNSSLERALIVWLDEVDFVKKRSATESLKSLVTEPVIQINEKHQPSRQVDSYHRFFAASNSDFYKPTDRDDRRDFVLRVSDTYKGDHKYWNALNEEIENGGVEALAHALINHNLSSFNVRDKPQTEELMRQKLQSLDANVQWWHHCLAQGEISDGDGWPKFLSTEDALEALVKYTGGKSRKPSPLSLANKLKELCPSVTQQQVTTGSSRKRGFVLPNIKRARSEFSSYMGGNLNW